MTAALSNTRRHAHALRHAAAALPRYADARLLAFRAAAQGWLGRLAREVGLERLLECEVDDADAVELAIYRAHHARAVRSASPLALDLLRHSGMDPDDAAWSLEANGDWRRWICGERPLLAAAMVGRWKGRPPPPAREDHDRTAFLHGGILIRGWRDASGALGARLSPHGLEVGARIGGVHLRTLGGVATMTTGRDVPDTVRAAAVGRRVDAIFDHPVLNGRGYVVHWSGDYEGDVPFPAERRPWRILFGAEPVEWRVPWAEDRA